jgi:hypothetical protein
MTKRHKRTERGSYYRALAEGYKVLKPTVADSFQSAADHYDQNDPPLEPVVKAGDDERDRREVD